MASCGDTSRRGSRQAGGEGGRYEDISSESGLILLCGVTRESSAVVTQTGVGGGLPGVPPPAKVPTPAGAERAVETVGLAAQQGGPPRLENKQKLGDETQGHPVRESPENSSQLSPFATRE